MHARRLLLKARNVAMSLLSVYSAKQGHFLSHVAKWPNTIEVAQCDHTSPVYSQDVIQ